MNPLPNNSQDTINTFIQGGILLVTAFGLLMAIRQLKGTKKISRGEFLLHLDEMLREHKEVHLNLRPNGKWSFDNTGPQSNEEWVLVEMYMGLFERIKVLIDDGIIEIKTFDRLYGYRIINIVRNRRICDAKLNKEAKDWKDFIELWKSLKKYNPRKYETRNTCI